MASKQKFSRKELTVPAGIVLGLLVAMIITVIGAAIYAYLVSSEKTEWNGIGIPVIMMLASAGGAWTALRKIKQKKVMVCGIFGVAFLLTLQAMTALFFGGQYEGVGGTALLVFAGSSSALLSGILGNKRRVRGSKIPVYR